ncbi:MAG: two-component system sensor histidine kinase AtoS [Sporomusaceae bacterium]|nr:two-component system sensor histidine kinase AtoS [Sporomusaceae bacterium]
MKWWPHSLRHKMILLMVLTVMIPMLLTGYIVKTEAENALLAEKRAKLFGIARLLDAHLGAGFDPILAANRAGHYDRSGKIGLLNAVLAQYTDTVAVNEPGVGVGYYSKELDAIITYGPSGKYADRVGLSIAADHPGRDVMDSGVSQVQFGRFVRGHIMNAMLPIRRGDQVLGYIWVNEFTDEVGAQLAAMDRKIYLWGGCGIAVCVALLLLVMERFVGEVETIKQGLADLRFNLKRQIRPMRGETGEIARAINHMAQSLAAMQSVNANILASIADGVITVDIEGRITTINPAAQRMTKFTSAEIVGRLYKDIFCSGTNFDSMLLDTLATGTNYIGFETEYPVKDASIYISISTSHLKDSDGRIIGAVLVFKDFTEKRRLQEQLRRADKLASLGEMMAGVAHEIRNPLTAIKGFVQYLQAAASDAERQQYMPVIVKEVDRVNRTIDELLYFARPNSADYQPVDLNDLIEKTLFLVRNKPTKERVAFAFHPVAGLPRVEADADQIRQVLLNLMLNAVQSIRGRGEISVRTWQEESEAVMLEIRDTGEGIAEADLNKIFDPFFTTKPAGTGLGLAVAQRIVTTHRGRLSIVSELGKGTAISLRLPVLQERERADEC